jgi:tetratricopeptide (TPR) repeat protein
MPSGRLLPLALVLLTVACFANGLATPFQFDDARLAMEDPPGFWMRPVLWWTVLANRRLASGGTYGYHGVNLAIHVAAGLLLYDLIRRTLARLPDWGEPHARSSFAFAAALLWLVHPLQTESVTYLSGRSESLAGLAYLTTLYAVARAALSARPRPWLALSLVAFALGMGVKEILATAPLVVLLYDRSFLSGSFAGALRGRRGFYAALFAADLVIATFSIGPQLLEEGGVAGFDAAVFGPWEYLRTQAGVLLHYLGLAFVPRGQCIDYWWRAAGGVEEWLPQGLAIATLLGLTAWGLARRAPWAFLGAWFFLVLAPTSSFVPQQDAACERRMYLSLAAVAVAAVAGGWRLARLAPVPPARLVVAGSLLLAVPLGYATVRRNQSYASPLVLWQNTVDRAPHNWRAQLAFGTELLLAGRLEEASAALERSIELHPRPNTFLLLAEARERLGRFERALLAYEGAELLRPDHSETRQRRARLHVRLGAAALDRQVWVEAEGHFRAALALDPAVPAGHGGLARALFQQSQREAALAELEPALEEEPDDASLHTLRGACLSALGRPAEAVEPFRRALTLPPETAEEHFNLGRALLEADAAVDALPHARNAVLLAPAHPQMQDLLARARLASPEAAERLLAVSAAEEAARLSGYAKPRLLETLARAHAARGERERARAVLERALGLIPPGEDELRQQLEARLREL